jgi:hypothetical protein
MFVDQLVGSFDNGRPISICELLCGGPGANSQDDYYNLCCMRVSKSMCTTILLLIVVVSSYIFFLSLIVQQGGNVDGSNSGAGTHPDQPI